MARARSKSIEELTLADLEANPVWRYVGGETVVRPVTRLPVTNLSGAVVAAPLALPNGSQVWGLLGNIDPASESKTTHFLSVSVLSRGHWFHLARYHDPDRTDRGPQALAEFLGLTVPHVFPLTYDISGWCIGLAGVVQGAIPAEPPVRLSRVELIGLSVP